MKVTSILTTFVDGSLTSRTTDPPLGSVISNTGLLSVKLIPVPLPKRFVLLVTSGVIMMRLAVTNVSISSISIHVNGGVLVLTTGVTDTDDVVKLLVYVWKGDVTGVLDVDIPGAPELVTTVALVPAAVVPDGLDVPALVPLPVGVEKL